MTTLLRLPLAIITREPPLAWKRSTYESMRPAVVGPNEPEAMPGGVFAGTGVVDGVVLEVLGQSLAAVEALLELGVGDVAGDDDGAGEEERRRDGVLRAARRGSRPWAG